ncbi:MAG: hypothetical protein AAF639_01300 [Chloroflexota bacterium]
MISEVIIRHIYRFFFLVLASYGIFYFSYKYYIPWPGHNDYNQYYPMYVEPLDFDKAQSPFVYRQLSAVVVNMLYETGIFYPNEIQFVSSAYDQRVFFSVLLSNYLALLLTAMIVGMSVSRLVKRNTLLPPLLAELLCFTAFFTQRGVLTEMTEGWSWFLIALGFYAYLNRRLWMTILVLLLSIFQRETIPLIFGVFSVLDWAIDSWQEPSKKTSRFFIWIFVGAVFSFGSYLVMRTVLFPVAEYGSGTQLDMRTMLANLMHFGVDIFSFNLSRELVFQGFITQNTYLILGLTVLMCMYTHRRQLGDFLLKKSYFVQITSALLLLDLVGIAAGIGNNIGRIAAVLTPVIAVYSVVLMTDLDAKS